MKEMKQQAVILQRKGLIEFGIRPIPRIEDPHFVKVQVKATGICGSDIHFYTQGSIGDFVVDSPMVLGHESSGVIVEIGSLVNTVKVGDRVAIEPGVPSRYSAETLSGGYNLCPHMSFAATPGNDGTLVKYYLSPEDFVYKLPDNISFEEGALLEPLAVGVHANKLACTTFGKRVVVFGAGPVGLLTGAVAKAFGATEVVVIDRNTPKLERAKKYFGATATINTSNFNNSNEKDIACEIWKIMNGERPSIVFECSGAEACLRASINCCKSGGTIIQVAMGKDDQSIPINVVSIKELTLKGCFRYCQGDYQDAMALLAQGKVDLERLITHRFTFDQAIEAYNFNVSNGQEVCKAVISGPTLSAL